MFSIAPQYGKLEDFLFFLFPGDIIGFIAARSMAVNLGVEVFEGSPSAAFCACATHVPRKKFSFFF